jgi:signal peptidase
VTLPRWAHWAAGWWLLLVASLTGFATFPVLLGYRPVVVVSGSMQPAVKPGDVAVVQPVGSGALGAVRGAIRVGDVVLVHDPAGPGQLLLRVVEVRPAGAQVRPVSQA